MAGYVAETCVCKYAKSIVYIYKIVVSPVWIMYAVEVQA